MNKPQASHDVSATETSSFVVLPRRAIDAASTITTPKSELLSAYELKCFGTFGVFQQLKKLSVITDF